MVLQRAIRWLLPREDHFFTYLEGLADESVKMIATLRRFGQNGTSTAEQLRVKIQDHEHTGDKFVHQMEEALAATFVTPIDREDLQRIAVELDSILDLVNSAVRACVLLGVDKPTAPMTALFEILDRCTEQVKKAVAHLRARSYEALVNDARAVRSIEKDGDKVYREAVSALFRDEGVDFRRLLREREVLEHLEGAVDACERVSHTLVNVAVKHA